MPDPIIEPTTTIVESKRPRPRLNSVSSAVAAVGVRAASVVIRRPFRIGFRWRARHYTRAGGGLLALDLVQHSRSAASCSSSATASAACPAARPLQRAGAGDRRAAGGRRPDVARSRGVDARHLRHALQTPMMIAFFTTVGFGASLSLLRVGGPQVADLLRRLARWPRRAERHRRRRGDAARAAPAVRRAGRVGDADRRAGDRAGVRAAVRAGRRARRRPRSPSPRRWSASSRAA